MQAQLDITTATLAMGHSVVCCFVNDDLSSEVVDKLADIGVEYASLSNSCLPWGGLHTDMLCQVCFHGYVHRPW